MNREARAPGGSARAAGSPGLPESVDRASFEAELGALRVREKTHTREGDAIAAARRQLPMVEVEAGLELIGPRGSTSLIEAFEGRRQLIAYYFMWNPGRPAPEQCEGCTFFTSQVRELAYLHARDVTFAVLCQGRNCAVEGAEPQASYDESLRYRDFMGWDVPWYSAQPSLDALLIGRRPGLYHLVCYVRHGERVFETYWTTGRGVEVMDQTLGLLDRTVFGRQEPWEDSPDGWPRDADYQSWRRNGRPISQWSRLEAGRDDSLVRRDR